jgi:beta-lactamase superfamily II metal-dependent hydrolase
MPDQFSPPADDELEVSVFGPGFGESVLIHVGEKIWIAIDSCKDSITNRSAPLVYLEKLGFDPSKDIRVVVASHWHDDHVKGLGELFNAASSAILCCSPVLTSKELLALAEIYSKPGDKISKGAEELKKCITYAKERTQKFGKQNLFNATPDRPIWQLTAPKLNAKLTSLSPSDQMNHKSIEFMVGYIKLLNQGITEPRLNASYPNDVAVALLLEVNERQILLGSDLEENGDPLVGWSAVMSGHVAPSSKSCTYKVAHHGSKSGHHAPVWNKILQPEPLAIMTPFRYGRHKIPTEADRLRILAITSNAYISADPNRITKPHKKTPKVHAILKQTVKNLRVTNGSVGHVRWRALINDPKDVGTIDLFDGALKLADVV